MVSQNSQYDEALVQQRSTPKVGTERAQLDDYSSQQQLQAAALQADYNM